MNTLLVFFALPIATILLAIVLQKILKCPLLVAATFFAIYLIVTFAAFDINFLIYAILYTILAYVTAVLTRLICNLMRCLLNNTTTRSNQTEWQCAQRPITISATCPETSTNTINNTCPRTNINTINDNNLLMTMPTQTTSTRRNSGCSCNRR